MEILKELSAILDKTRVRSLELIGQAEEKHLLVNKFYEGILHQKFETDEDAAAFFYGSSPSAPSYKSLKHNLLKRMVNSLFFLNPQPPAYNDYERDYFFCCKFMAAAKILLRMQAGNAGILLCQKVLSKASKNEFTEFLMESSKFLRGYFGTRKGNWKLFLFYNDIFKKAEKDWIAENLAQEFYIRLMIPYTNEKATKSKTYDDATSYLEQLRPFLSESSSPYLHFLGYYIDVIRFFSIKDYQQAIQVCQKALDFFEAKPFVYKTPLSTFYHNMLACRTQLRHFEGSAELVKKAEKLNQPGTHNWFRGQELYFILALHTQNYQDAYYIFTNAVDHSRYRFLSHPFQETWRIYESYLHFLVEVGKLTPETSDNRFNNFKLGKFLNSVPIFSKDKRGMNIPILVIQILFLIVRKEYHMVIDRMETIEKYCVRHLVKSPMLRSNYFIKMLMEIPRSNFHISAIERKTDRFLAKLKATPLEIVNQTHEIEIIPYENLWACILQSLDKQRLKNSYAAIRAARASRQE